MRFWRGVDRQRGVWRESRARGRRRFELAALHGIMRTVRCLVRQRAAAASRAWAIRYSRWLGKDEAMASLMRRTETRTSAPILSNLRRMVAQLALANCVGLRAMRRKAQRRT